MLTRIPIGLRFEEPVLDAKRWPKEGYITSRDWKRFDLVEEPKGVVRVRVTGGNALYKIIEFDTDLRAWLVRLISFAWASLHNERSRAKRKGGA